MGSFGAGLLDAVAVLMKHGCVLKAESYCSVFTFEKGPDNVIYLKEEFAPTSKPGTKWTIHGSFSDAEREDAIQNFLIFNPTKPFLRFNGLEVYTTRGEEGRLYIDGMRMNGVTPLGFHYNFTEKDTRKYGRDHQVSYDAFEKELKPVMVDMYAAFPERFYDAVQLANPEVLDKCIEKRETYMHDVFYTTTRPRLRHVYSEQAPKAPPPRPPPRSTVRATTLQRPQSQPVFNIIDNAVACLPASEGDLQDMYKANKVGKLSAQGMKERLEQKWLKGIDCTVRLGGSLKKGVATRDSDVDMVVSVAPEDLAAAEQAVSAKAREGDVSYLPAAQGQKGTGPLLATVTTGLGKVDVVVTTPGKPVSGRSSLNEELEWAASVGQKHPRFKRAVVLLKVWKERNNLPLRGAAVENVVADACEASKDGTLPDVLCTALKGLAKGKQCLNAQFGCKDDVAADIKDNDWKDVVAAATAQLQAFGETTATAP